MYEGNLSNYWLDVGVSPLAIRSTDSPSHHRWELIPPTTHPFSSLVQAYRARSGLFVTKQLTLSLTSTAVFSQRNQVEKLLPFALFRFLTSRFFFKFHNHQFSHLPIMQSISNMGYYLRLIILYIALSSASALPYSRQRRRIFDIFARHRGDDDITYSWRNHHFYELLRNVHR